MDTRVYSKNRLILFHCAVQESQEESHMFHFDCREEGQPGIDAHGRQRQVEVRVPQNRVQLQKRKFREEACTW